MHGVVYNWGSSVRNRPMGRGERLLAFAIRVCITAIGVWVAAWLIGGIRLDGLGTTLFVAFTLGLLNAYLKPLLVVGTFPLLIMTLGIGLIVVNTALLGLTAWTVGKFTGNFAIDGFWSAFWGAVVISIVSFCITRFVNPKDIARNVAGR